jgi:hypothetical protein
VTSVPAEDRRTKPDSRHTTPPSFPWGKRLATDAADSRVEPIAWLDHDPIAMPTRDGGRSCVRPSPGGELKLQIEHRAEDGTYGLETYLIYRSEALQLVGQMKCAPADLPLTLASYPAADEGKCERTFEGLIAYINRSLDTSKGSSTSWGARMPD